MGAVESYRANGGGPGGFGEGLDKLYPGALRLGRVACARPFCVSFARPVCGLLPCHSALNKNACSDAAGASPAIAALLCTSLPPLPTLLLPRAAASALCRPPVPCAAPRLLLSQAAPLTPWAWLTTP